MDNDVIRLVFDVVLGGGWLYQWINMRSLKKKTRAEALQVEMELGKSYVDEYSKNIVEPLKEKVTELGKDINGLKRELARLRKAINKTNSCQWVDSCPVVRELQNTEESTEGARANAEGGYQRDIFTQS